MTVTKGTSGTAVIKEAELVVLERSHTRPSNEVIFNSRSMETSGYSIIWASTCVLQLLLQVPQRENTATYLASSV